MFRRETLDLAGRDFFENPHVIKIRLVFASYYRLKTPAKRLPISAFMCAIWKPHKLRIRDSDFCNARVVSEYRL